MRFPIIQQGLGALFLVLVSRFSLGVRLSTFLFLLFPLLLPAFVLSFGSLLLLLLLREPFLLPLTTLFLSQFFSLAAKGFFSVPPALYFRLFFLFRPLGLLDSPEPFFRAEFGGTMKRGRGG